MTEYIEREAALETAFEQFTMSMCVSVSEYENMNRARGIIYRQLRKIPAADVEKVRHGRWVDMGDFISCSVCTGTRMKEFVCYYGKATRLDVRTNYCPNCGARMDGGGEE